MGQKNSNDNNEHKMRDHYEVLDVPCTATIDDIKKAYKKAALKWHPDRNHGQEELATEMFKEVSAAYNVLSDPNERKWYDDHKSSILRGNNSGADSNEDVKTDISNLWSYFSHTCYSGPDEGPSGFYTIYRSVFNRLDEEESNENRNRTPYPTFGDSSTNPKDVLRFYTFWLNFVTGLSFSWEDQYDARDAPNRDTRRAIDKENKKFRDKTRKEYNDLVKSLASYVRKRDPRIKAIDEENQRLREEAEELRKIHKLEKQEEKRQLREQAKILQETDVEEIKRRNEERQGAYLLADDESDEDTDENDEDIEEKEAILQQKLELKRNQKKYNIHTSDDEEDNDDDDDTEHNCDVCNKIFKTSQQLSQHLASKVHRQAVKDFEKKIKKSNKGKKSLPENVEEQGSDHDSNTKITTTTTTTETTKTTNLNNDINEESIFAALNDMKIDPKKNHRCEVCGYEAKSRNMLYQHINEKGHAALKDVSSEEKIDKKKKKNKLRI